MQAADGYAYNVAVQRFNLDYAGEVSSFVSTDAQGDWWGGAGGGTVAHAAIACFFGDTAEAMLAFCATRPPQIPRIALVDFNNDSVGDSLATLDAMFARYRALMEAGDETEAAEICAVWRAARHQRQRARCVGAAAGRPQPGFGRYAAPGVQRPAGAGHGLGTLAQPARPLAGAAPRISAAT